MTRPAQNRIHNREPANNQSITIGDNARRSAAELGSSELLAKITDFYMQEAQRRGSTFEAVKIALNYSPEEIRRSIEARA